MPFNVVQVIDPTTIEILEKWIWNNLSGDRIIVSNIQVDQKKIAESTDKLKEVLNNKKIELINPQRVTSGALVCEVLVDGTNLAELLVR